MSIYPQELEAAPPLVLRQPVLYADINYDVGKINGRFFAALRDEKRILATRCPTCEQRYVPPRMSCHECFAELDEWVDAGLDGTLVSFTIVRTPGMLQPAPLPYVLGLIQLDGADTALVHLVGGVQPADVQIGMRVRAEFAEERAGNIHDIRCFSRLEG